MFTFETARLDGGGEFTRKEKLFKRFSLGDLPGAGAAGPDGGEGRPLPGAAGAGTRAGWCGMGKGVGTNAPSLLPSLYKEVAGF